MTYKIHLDIFEGPLDLLIYLIKKNDIDVHDIPISKVTEQYMQYIEMMKILDLDIVGDFLVMAATLMQIKSKMLLPPDPSEEGEEEDPRDELVNRIKEYQRFKEIADILEVKAKERKDLIPRKIDEEERQKLQKESREVYFEANLFDLINAFSEALKRAPEEIIHEIVKEEYTVDQKIHEILHALLDSDSILLKELIQKARSRVEIVVSFLAILELIRLKEIKVVQKTIFGDIEIYRNKDNIVPAASGEEDESVQSHENDETAQPQEQTEPSDS